MNIKCPSCNSQRIWKDGIRQTGRGEVQRYICRACGLRFSETSWNGSNDSNDSKHVRRVHTTALYSVQALPINRQVGVTETQGAKNLAEVESRIEKRAAGATLKPSEADVKGKIVEFAWWMKKQGYSKDTILESVKKLNAFLKLNADLFDPENIKETIAVQSWKNSTKRLIATIYTRFLTFLGLTWTKPKYAKSESLPFIPMEQEIDQLIASCGPKLAVFLQGLKETGADPGELIALRWIDINMESRTVTINYPVKGHDPRILPVSAKFLDMVQRRQKQSEKVFGDTIEKNMYNNLFQQRKAAATKLANPRLNKITFVTLRHWKGTMEYHKTKDPYHVKKVLGHKSLQSTEIYINIEQALFLQGSDDEYHVKVAHNVDEACKLVEVGFTYVTGEYSDGGKIFRKRK